MTATTVTEYTARTCSRCGGAGRIAAFQHRNGGECFRCGATGIDPKMIETTREMTDAEVISALNAHGFAIVDFTPARPVTGDYLTDLFMNDEQVEAEKTVMTMARLLLAAA
jgi:ribosomal protein S27AE